ncbi:essential protein Yae1, putative [Trichophyton verrucosum HKI 0517]|uniref:Protein YAE1 n=1 Tax=Trichophyton verrucosum (strain HKI 0517) TaxID=663202 RepID=D4DG43_TRIVH|nr:essential protein Yae1, putative [Trichophyton verrucosum HKI 0517]EFE39176.1 essential protein Yae1, putative [Trichophyton verrucosum HKI 0517]
MSSPSPGEEAGRLTDMASNGLDDIFGSSPPRTAAETTAASAADEDGDMLGSRAGENTVPSLAESSDLPSLRRQHVTAGYRDGVTAAKGEHVQRGFDKGYPVGAELGVRVGIVLGVLEGLVKALSSGGGGGEEEEKAEDKDSRAASRARVTALFETAKRELVLERIFSLEEQGTVKEVERGEEGEGEDHGDPYSRLGQAGDTAVTRWEDRVRILLAELR